MKHGDREVMVKLVLPLPLPLATRLMRAVGKAAEKEGYTDVVILTEGPHAGSIAGTPPARSEEAPDA